jgi:hypothetical protein
MNKRIYYFLVAIVLTFGCLIRLYHLSIVGCSTPFHLGGLFYEFSDEIIKNNFWLPKTIPYYFPGGLPFAYPPLPFYFQAVLVKIFSPTDFVTVNLLPALISIFGLFAFYYLAKRIYKSEWGILIALSAFAFLPTAFAEQIEGQGLSESFGTLAIILYLYTLSFDFKVDSRKRLFWAGLMFGLCILSSPGSLYAGILISLVYGVICIRNIFWICLIGTFVSSPYWMTVIFYHGINIFLEPFLSQQGNLWKQLAWSVYENIWLLPLSWKGLMLVGIIGTIYLKKHFHLLLFFVVLLIPREVWLLSIPMAILIGYGAELTVVSVPPLILVVLVLISASRFTFTAWIKLVDDKSMQISKTEIDNLIDKKDKIPLSGQVFVEGGSGVLEWAPYILKREVVNNYFGLEWLPRFKEEAMSMTRDKYQKGDLYVIKGDKLDKINNK